MAAKKLGLKRKNWTKAYEARLRADYEKLLAHIQPDSVRKYGIDLAIEGLKLRFIARRAERTGRLPRGWVWHPDPNTVKGKLRATPADCVGS